MVEQRTFPVAGLLSWLNPLRVNKQRINSGSMFAPGQLIIRTFAA
jgi:hypothetical protein